MANKKKINIDLPLFWGNSTIKYAVVAWVLVGVDLKKHIILALNSYLMPPGTFRELHNRNGKTYR